MAVEYRLTHISGLDGSETLIRDWTSAFPTDGAFDSATEGFSVHDTAPNSLLGDSDRLELRATADGISTTSAEVMQAVRDLAAPSSEPGPIDPVYTGSSISLPFTVQDDHLGPLTVELWVRYRPSEAAQWTAFSQVGSRYASTTPFSYSFASGDGIYEFTTVGIDESGNREAPAPPTSGDVSTMGDAIDDPPAVSASLSADRSGGTVALSGGGIAADDRSVVSVRWRLYAVKNGGQRTLVKDWSAADPTDGAFDERVEDFSISDSRGLSGTYTSYLVQIEVTAGGVTVSENYGVPIQ